MHKLLEHITLAGRAAVDVSRARETVVLFAEEDHVTLRGRVLGCSSRQTTILLDNGSHAVFDFVYSVRSDQALLRRRLSRGRLGRLFRLVEGGR